MACAAPGPYSEHPQGAQPWHPRAPMAFRHAGAMLSMVARSESQKPGCPGVKLMISWKGLPT
eukprot:4551464-Pyramimonas_sp.AAC.1